MSARLLALVALAALSGCRYDLQHIHEGKVPSARTVARLVPGKTTLHEALAIAGAPDGLLWMPASDVLVYDQASQLRSFWQLENPATFVGRIGPQAIAGEAVSFVMYAAARSGQGGVTRLQRSRRPPGPQTTPPFTSRPLTLEGDVAGREQVLLVFDRETQVLQAVEVARGRPEGGVGGAARGTFLR